QRSFERSRSPRAANYYAIELYHLGRFDEVLQCLDQRRRPEGGSSGDRIRAFALAERPDGPRLALQEFEQNARNLPENRLRDWIDVLLLLGEKEMAVAVCSKPTEPDPDQFWDQTQFPEAKWQFVRGELSEEHYLAKAGTSRPRKVEAQYHIGLFR